MVGAVGVGRILSPLVVRSRTLGGMARTLFLMRHAKSVDHDALRDHSRALAPLGRQQAADAGLMLANRGIELILCSSATRCVQTAQGLDLRLPDTTPVPMQVMDALYLSSSDQLRQRISEIEDDVTGLLVVAHSPGIPTLSAELAWQSDRRAADQMQCHFPTAAFSEYTIAGSWADLADESADVKLTGTDRPPKASR